MSAATIERQNARRSAPKPASEPQAALVSEHDLPAVGFDYLDADRRLRRAAGMSTMLSTIFDAATAVSPSEISDLEGLMGTLQHLRHALAGLHVDVMATDEAMPEDFREATFEA